MDDNTTDALELATMIEALRGDLRIAQAAGRGQDLAFTVSAVEIEASVEVRREKEGRGGIKFYVVEAGAASSASRASTQRIHVSLVPARPVTVSSNGKGE